MIHFAARVHELCESRGGRSRRLSVLMSLTVSVDVNQHWTMLRHWSLFVSNMSTRLPRTWSSISSLLPTRTLSFMLAWSILPSTQTLIIIRRCYILPSTHTITYWHDLYSLCCLMLVGSAVQSMASDEHLVHVECLLKHYDKHTMVHYIPYTFQNVLLTHRLVWDYTVMVGKLQFWSASSFVSKISEWFLH